MKKTLLSLALCCATMLAQATILEDETFTDFPTGWATSGSVTTPTSGADRQAVSPLTFSNTGGTYSLSGKGKGVKSAHDASSAYFHTKALAVDSIASGTFYLSFIFKADGQQKAANAQVFGLSQSETSAALRFWVGKDPAATPDATKCRFGITRASGKGAEVQWGSTLVNVDEEHLIVIKYSIEDSLATLYVDPLVDGSEPATAFATDGTMGAAKKNFKYFCFYSTGNTKTYFTMSGVRLSTTWAEAVASGEAAPQEEPSYANSLFANFTDSLVWTNRVDAAPASGSFTNDTLNGYILTAAAVVKSGKTLYFDTDSVDYVKFVSRLHMDKNTYKGSIEMPWVANIDTLYLYGHSGSDSKDCKLEYRVANGKWTQLCTFTNMKTDQIFALPVKMQNVKLRLSNATTSAQYFFYIGDVHPRTFAEHKSTALDLLQADKKAVKVVENGQLIIVRNGERFTLTGEKL